ncbi:unnamed protein product [Rhizoctonia solani]|uniref:Uncharacterized protein n=1 Tax=Rhizoctonia solani TaxID=456999 RepID=A0A8H3E8S1_9AGAM|nr:unnamed protein product [Rhizoctonia solani]
MKNLPAELVHLIIRHDRSTSLPLGLANKQYYYIVMPVLYERVTLKGGRAINAFYNTLVMGNPMLREYPRSLHLERVSLTPFDDAGSQRQAVKQLLMHVPNITDLNLALDRSTIQYLLEDPQYPFRLLKLEIFPRKNASFVEFLKTQPDIQQLTLNFDPYLEHYYPTDWSEVTSPLAPDILPKLKSVQSDMAGLGFLVPSRPITSISISDFQEYTGFHKILAKSSAPLEYLKERIHLKSFSWGTTIASQCLPSLKFCHTSLIEYSLRIFPKSYVSNSVLFFLEDDRSNSLAKIRGALSAFPGLKKFTLSFRSDQFNDLTPQFCESVPELSRFQVWKECCPKLEEVIIFGIRLIGA